MPVFPSSFSHFLNFSSPLFGPIILVFGCGFSSVGWISGLSEMVLLQGAGSCPTHSTAYQPHIQLSMKEGWKDRSIIGWKERGKASEGQRMERWEDVVMEKGERGTLDGKKEQKLVWLKNGGMKQRSESARGLCGRKPGKWVSGCRGYSLLVFLFFFFFTFLLSSCFPYNFLLGGLLGFYLSSLSFTFSFLPYSGSWQADRGHDGRCPLRVRQHFLSVPEARSGSMRRRPTLASFSVCEVQLLCSVTPLTTPISAARGLCKLELTTRPCFSKSAQWLCHSERATFNHISALWLFSLSLCHRAQNSFMRS